MTLRKNWWECNVWYYGGSKEIDIICFWHFRFIGWQHLTEDSNVLGVGQSFNFLKKIEINKIKITIKSSNIKIIWKKLKGRQIPIYSPKKSHPTIHFPSLWKHALDFLFSLFIWVLSNGKDCILVDCDTLGFTNNPSIYFISLNIVLILLIWSLLLKFRLSVYLVFELSKLTILIFFHHYLASYDPWAFKSVWPSWFKFEF